MADHRLLFVDVSRLAAFRWDRGALRPEGEFASDEAGIRAFETYVREHRESLLSIVADVADEGFQTETVPFVRGSDRTALIKRKLGQLFYGTPLSTAVPQGREPAGRRDERLLFVALTRPQQFEPWLAALRQAEGQLAGLYSVSIVAPALAERGKPDQPHLLVTLTRSGLRQTFFDDGQLRFSRLTPLVGGSAQDWATAAALESARTYQYLAGQRLFNRGGQLRAVVLAHPADIAAFRERCVDSDELHFEFADLAAKAKALGLREPPADSRCETLFMHLVAKQAPRFQLAPPAEQRFYRIWQFKFALNGAAAVVLLGCLLFAAREAYEYVTMNDNAATLQTQTQSDRQRYDSVMKALPPMPMGADNLRAVVGRFDDLKRRSGSIEGTYGIISHALDNAPQVELSRIDWRIAASPDEAMAGTSAPAERAASGAPAGPGPFAVADVFAQLPAGMVSDHRAILATVDGFVAALRSDSVQVKVLSMPFDIESGKTLKSDNEATEGMTAPKFAVRLVQRL